jgi:hypothetical protein
MSYDPQWVRRDTLARFRTVKLSEIAEAAGCSKAFASDIRKGKWTPRGSTWAVLARVGSIALTVRLRTEGGRDRQRGDAN